MEKLVYVLWRPDDMHPEAFRAGLLLDVSAEFRRLGVHGLTLNLVDAHVDHALGARLTRLDPPPAATINFWVDAASERAVYEDLLRGATARMAGYWVAESVPIVNTTQRAPEGQRTPGINMIALLERPERMAWDAWIDRWHGPHRIVALETQCTFHYVRNVVLRALTPDAPPWSGIVEEGFPADAVTDPMKWYNANGSQERLNENLGRMVESCRAFLDLEKVESHPMSEYRLLG
jgi:hypothetical protein